MGWLQAFLTMSYIAIVSILVTSAATVVYYTTIWDPVQLTTKFSSTVVVVIGLLMVVLATMSVNVAANVVSPVPARQPLLVRRRVELAGR